MGKMSLTNMGVAFIIVVLLFTVFSLGYGIANINGYNTTGVNETVFTVFGNETQVEEYIDDTTDSVEGITVEKDLFDVFGTMLNLGWGTIKVIGSGVNFLIGGVGNLLGYIGINSVIADYIGFILIFIFGATMVFSVILGRRDRLE